MLTVVWNIATREFFCGFVLIPGYNKALRRIFPTCMKVTNGNSKWSSHLNNYNYRLLTSTPWMNKHYKKKVTWTNLISNNNCRFGFLGSLADTFLAFNRQLTHSFIFPYIFIFWITRLNIPRVTVKDIIGMNTTRSSWIEARAEKFKMLS